jgi:hypothetical protein
MKKVITLVGLSLLLSGCGSTLICNPPSGENDVDISYKVKYSGDVVNKVILNKTYNFSSKEELENYTAILNYAKNTESTSNITIDSKKSGNKYDLIYNYNVKNMKDDELSKAGLKHSKNELVEYLTNNGFTCK